MASSNDYDPTPKEYDEACRLVGRFMNAWAFLESALNDGVASTLGMAKLEGMIATSNMQARSKIHIIKTLINLLGSPEDWKAKAVKTVEAIADKSVLRNTVAHVAFTPDGNGGVEFFAVKAKGKFHFPKMIWSRNQFEAHEAEMEKLTDELKLIIKRLQASRLLMKLADQLASGKQPPPNALNPLFHLLAGDPNSPPATPETEGENPPPLLK